MLTLTKKCNKINYISEASQTVWLTAEDNSFWGGGYYVSGYWDEETGHLPD